MKADIEVVKDKEALGRTAAETIVRRMNETLKTRDFSAVALSGGSTPKSIYTLLATDSTFREKVPWGETHFFWGDERHVPPDHPESNYRMTYDAMLSRVSIPPENVHRVPAEYPDADRAAKEYEQELLISFGLSEGQLPQFSCVLLGMGPDGHTASLFPGTTALKEKERLVVSNWVEKFRTFRITMTLPVLNNADVIIFLVSGGEKAEMLREVLEEDAKADPLPSQLIKPTHGKLVWLVDEAAASGLAKSGYLK